MGEERDRMRMRSDVTGNRFSGGAGAGASLPPVWTMFLIAVGINLLAGMQELDSLDSLAPPPKHGSIALHAASFGFLVVATVRHARRCQWSFSIRKPFHTVMSALGSIGSLFWMTVVAEIPRGLLLAWGHGVPGF
jgi:hypothetical protein